MSKKNEDTGGEVLLIAVIGIFIAGIILEPLAFIRAYRIKDKDIYASAAILISGFYCAIVGILLTAALIGSALD